MERAQLELKRLLQSEVVLLFTDGTVWVEHPFLKGLEMDQRLL
jgi:hypothetical protein